MSLAIAVLAAIAFLAVIHRAILAAFLASCGLVRRENRRTNRRRKHGEEDLSVTFHRTLIFSSGP